MPEKSPYTGELAKKLPRADDEEMAAALSRHDRAAFSEAFRVQFARKQKKLALLIKHFEIESEDDSIEEQLAVYKDLAMCLAERYVPGFQVEGARGRPKQWTPPLRRKAALALYRLNARHPRLNETQLAALLHKESPWNELSRTPGALLKQIRLLNADNAHELAALGASGKPVNRLLELLLQRPNGKKSRAT